MNIFFVPIVAVFNGRRACARWNIVFVLPQWTGTVHSRMVESIQQSRAKGFALCKAKMVHNLYLPRASFYYTPNWIESSRDEFTKLIASCASVLRASNIFIYSFDGRGSALGKQFAGHLNVDQPCPKARKLLRCVSGAWGVRGGDADGFLVALQCKYLFRARASSPVLWPEGEDGKTKPQRSLRNAPGGVCVMRAAVWKPSVGHLSHSKTHTSWVELWLLPQWQFGVVERRFI